MYNGFRIGDYVSYWVGRQGSTDMYSDPVRITGVHEETIDVEGCDSVPIGNVRRIPISLEHFRIMGGSVYGDTAILSEQNPYVAYNDGLRRVTIIDYPFELRCECDTIDELQHALESMKCNFKVRL